MSKLEEKLIELYGLNYLKILAPKMGVTTQALKLNVILPHKMEGYIIAQLHSKVGMYRSEFENTYCHEAIK